MTRQHTADLGLGQHWLAQTTYSVPYSVRVHVSAQHPFLMYSLCVHLLYAYKFHDREITFANEPPSLVHANI